MDDHVRTQGRAGVHMLRTEASGGTRPAHTWVSDVQLPAGDTSMSFKPPVSGTFLAAQVHERHGTATCGHGWDAPWDRRSQLIQAGQGKASGKGAGPAVTSCRGEQMHHVSRTRWDVCSRSSGPQRQFQPEAQSVSSLAATLETHVAECLSHRARCQRILRSHNDFPTDLSSFWGWSSLARWGRGPGTRKPCGRRHSPRHPPAV